jgi:MoxR-like ATPase
MTTGEPAATSTESAGRPTSAGDLSIDGIQDRYGEHGYVADRQLAAALFLSLRLERPLLLEGEAGVGKTEVAKVLARVLGTRLIRLQCYEGLDVSTAVYEWNYPRQMLEIRLLEARGEARDAEAADIFTERFLIKRPLLQAIDSEGGPAPVLLIDEVDRADEEFEAYLLELLAEYQVTIPEIGSLRAEHPPRIILTSNRTREVHDALKRRCLYHWIAYPTFDKELAIIRARIPDVDEELARRVVGVTQRLRRIDLVKAPGVAETLEWTTALLALGARELTPAVLEETFGVIVKYEEDIHRLRSLIGELLRPGSDAPSPAA